MSDEMLEAIRKLLEAIELRLEDIVELLKAKK